MILNKPGILKSILGTANLTACRWFNWAQKLRHQGRHTAGAQISTPINRYLKNQKHIKIPDPKSVRRLL